MSFFIKTNEEIAENFRSTKEQIHAKGLSDSFKNCVLENPEKFTNNIKPFLNVPRIYQHALLWGLSEAWRLGKDINWQVVFDFIKNLITPDDFWDEKYSRFNYRNWIISRIAELIEEGTKDDNRAFSPEFLPVAENILLILVEKTIVLNSTKGKIFSAMVNYSLRYARLYKRKNEERWAENIKKEFTNRLNREIESSLEFSVILGEYLPSIYWLDKNWVIVNINKIFPIDNDIHWKSAFTGYLFYSSRVYKDIYFLLRENGHYAKAIKSEFSEPYITERLVQHICIGYLEDWEKLEDEKSLIFQLIENKNINQILEIVRYFWMFGNKLTDKIKSKVKPLWKKIYSLAKQNEENKEFQKIISDLSKWLVLIDEIDDEITEWLKLLVKYVDRDFDSTFFIEYLTKHASKTPKKVGEIYLEMLKAGIYPYYEQEQTQNIVRTLYENKEKEIADKICNLYGEKGYLFLKDIYKKYNNKDNHNA